MTYLYLIFIGYFIGSFPTAYILLKKFRQNDITLVGSKNVGAMNCYQVTNSKLLGITVFLIDFLKGLVVVLLTKFLISSSFTSLSIALIAAIIGHCFSIWINFKGGRGLSTAAGGVIVIAPLVLVIWVILWIVAYFYKRNIHFSNIVASFLVLILSFTSVDILSKYTFSIINNKNIVSFVISFIMILIFFGHAAPLKKQFNLLKKQCRRANV
ncbi:MAG: glycerol-3-phosphate acyltransferase [bacterium]